MGTVLHGSETHLGASSYTSPSIWPANAPTNREMLHSGYWTAWIGSRLSLSGKMSAWSSLAILGSQSDAH